MTDVSRDPSLLAVSKLYRVHRTCVEMARDRKYDIPDDVLFSSLERFKAAYQSADGVLHRDKMTITCMRPDTAELMFIFFNGSDTFSTEMLNQYESTAQANGAKRATIVLSGKVGSTTTKRLQQLSRSEFGVKVQLFHEDDLVVNITRHELVPKHTPLEEAELKEMLEAHSLQLHQLPRLLSTDPVALYFALERGQVVKITRKSESAGRYETYRQVV